HRRLLHPRQRARRRHQRRQDRVRGMRVRLCHGPRGRVLRILRAAELDWRDLCADREGAGRQDSDHLHGLRPLGVLASDWITSDDSVIAPMVKEAAAKYAAEKKLTPGCLVTN